MNHICTSPVSSGDDEQLDSSAMKSFPTARVQSVAAPAAHLAPGVPAADSVASRRGSDIEIDRGIASADLLPIGYFVVAPDGEIVLANHAFARGLGIDRDALRGAMLQSLLHPFEAGRFAAHLEICIAAREAVTLETTLRVQPERLVSVLFTSQARTLGGRIRVHITVANLAPVRQARRDVGELEREHALLVETLSHDARGALVTIRDFARILLEGRADDLGPLVKEAIERIERSSRRGEITLRELLAYLELRHEEPGLGRVETDQVVIGVVAQWREAAARRCAEIVVARPMPAVCACPRLLAMALGRLFGNALDFASPARPPRIWVSCDERDGAVMINVADAGVGIEARSYERIFQPGERVLAHPDGPGAGFGLAIVRRAIERMQGRVWVESEPGRGSCFHILLPRA